MYYMADKSKRISTTIKIDPDVLKKAKIHALQNDTTLSELVERSLKKEMKE
jgi:hypothetical protein